MRELRRGQAALVAEARQVGGTALVQRRPEHTPQSADVRRPVLDARVLKHSVL